MNRPTLKIELLRYPHEEGDVYLSFSILEEWFRKGEPKYPFNMIKAYKFNNYGRFYGEIKVCSSDVRKWYESINVAKYINIKGNHIELKEWSHE